MKAAWITGPGPANTLQFGEMPEPSAPDAGQIMVEVTFASINPIDTYIRGGLVAADLPERWIPGCDFAGRVAAIGAGVANFAVGDRVWGSHQGHGGRQGTLAERILAPVEWVYPVPDGVTDEAAAAGGLTGITAHLGLHLHGQLQPGETVFVNGGTGGVGSAVVQLAKSHGARVITTAGSDEKCAIAREHGADVAMNYRSEDIAAGIRVAAGDAGIHVWFETLRTPSPEQMIPLMARRGRMIVMAGRDARPILPVGPLYVNDLRLIGFAMFNASAVEQRAAALQINDALQAGRYRPIVGRTFPLREAAAAHQLQEDNTIHGAGTLTGKILVAIRDGAV